MHYIGIIANAQNNIARFVIMIDEVARMDVLQMRDLHRLVDISLLDMA